MTITRILALLSVVALLASLPVTVALGQGGGGSDAPPIPPFQVVGNATIDGEPAMDGTMVVAMIDGEKAGTGSVMDGKFSVDVMGETGAMIMFEFMTGEGDEAMMYKVMSEPGEVMVGMPGVPKIASLMAQGDGMMMTPKPTEPTVKPTARPVVAPVVPVKSVEAIVDEAIAEAMAEASAMMMENMPKDGKDGKNGTDGEDGTDGSNGSAGKAGASGSDGKDGSAGPSGAKGPAGPAGPAGPPGDAGAAGSQGESGGGGGILAIIALIIAIVGVVAAGGAFIAGRQSS